MQKNWCYSNIVTLIDLTAKSKVLVEGLGVEGSKRIYLSKEADGAEDNTHFSEYGANEMAKLFIEGIKELNIPLVSIPLEVSGCSI